MSTRDPLPDAIASRTWIGFVVLLVLSVGAEFFVHHHGIDAVAGSFGFSAWYSLLACAALVGITQLAGFLLTRPDNDYDG
jgi:hypothetical protein